MQKVAEVGCIVVGVGAVVEVVEIVEEGWSVEEVVVGMVDFLVGGVICFNVVEVVEVGLIFNPGVDGVGKIISSNV